MADFNIPKQKAPTWFVILFVVGIIFLMFKMCSGCTNQDTAKDLSSSSAVIATHYVKFVLTYPEEADFSVMDIESTLIDSVKQTYRVIGSVTSKNGFGVKSKVPFRCLLTYTGGAELADSAWKLEDIKIDK